MAESSDDRVALTDLDVITRYSLAVRAATADRAELIATLRADLEWLEDSAPASAPAPAPVRRPAAPSRTAQRKTTQSTTTQNTTKAAPRKAAPRRRSS